MTESEYMRRLVHDTFTDKEIHEYAKAWKCGRKEAERRLTTIIVV